MKVLFVSPEVAPFAKVGGIADVVGALPRALHRLGIDVRIMIPRYQNLAHMTRSAIHMENVEVLLGRAQERVNVWRTELPKSTIPVYLIEHDTYLGHGSIYNEHQTGDPFSEIARFLFFSAASLAVAPKLGWNPDIIHCHDWHTGILPALVRQKILYRMKTVLTIHNLAHQGVWNAHEVFRFLGIHEQDHPNLSERDTHGDLNLLQQGILGAHAVNTVSPQYAKEILSPEFGLGLETTLQRRSHDLVGILNGIDTEAYNPATDPSIRVQYSAKSLKKKVENKLALHERCGFRPNPDMPTLAFIGRLTEQKGVDLIVATAERFVRAGATLVMLGSGLPQIEEQLQRLGRKYPEHIFVKLGFDEVFAQQIYAGADIFLMPSKFEPCGIGQMIALRYGTPPVVRTTGGLKDTVPDVTTSPDRGLGFAFSEYSADAFWTAVERALTAYRSRKNWSALAIRGMKQDFSWDLSARSYLHLYERTRESP